MKVRKNVYWFIPGLLISELLIIALLVAILIPKERNTEENIPLPPDVVQLQDGSFTSMSQHYDRGYFDAVDVTIGYLFEKGYLKDTTVGIDIEYFLDTMHVKGQEYFTEYYSRMERINNR